jgi:hypothetical protein
MLHIPPLHLYSHKGVRIKENCALEKREIGTRPEAKGKDDTETETGRNGEPERLVVHHSEILRFR